MLSRSLLILLGGNAVWASPASPAERQILTSPSGRQFALLGGAHTNCQARQICHYVGGQLSDIQQGPDVPFLAQAVRSPAWINSWDGNAYEGTPLAFFPGGAMARPDECGDSPLAVLCDLPGPCQASDQSFQ